ncbi:uncharacterized protein Dana_GF18005 [Drosophila ananassae]|uniref:VM domain-containing protein n=1 Tax=Drosophila ananassae TaxID=7217 RepID=B3LV03_DROAN|nr:proline-rich antigen homolog [Drosophila ananassae]EDV42475.1 uncharacterized protein Dana_GF18005 [Drosophila ananassae]
MQFLELILLPILASFVYCRPTFGGYPHPGPGPLIQEGYEHGYDYHYGGGYGYQQGAPTVGYGYYPPPQLVHPPISYYPPPQPAPAYYSPPLATHKATVSYPHKSKEYYGASSSSSGGYKQSGY